MIAALVFATVLGLVLYNLGLWMELQCAVSKDRPDTTLIRLCRDNASLVKVLSYVSLVVAVSVGGYVAVSRR